MRLRSTLALGAIAAILPAAAAQAQPITGLYVGAGALWNFKQDEHSERRATGPSPRFQFDEGGVGGLGSVGYGLGNGLRFELEGDYRQNSIRSRAGTVVPSTTQAGTQQDYGVMVNALYDIDVSRYGVSFLTPYVGLGAGYQWSHIQGFQSVSSNGNVNHIGGTDGNFAYQGIVGAAFPVQSVPGLAVTAEYRFLGILGDQSFTSEQFSPAGLRSSTTKVTENLNHSVVLGIRYAFNAAPPPPPPAPVPVSVAPAQARTYLVFFDWDRADITDRARQIIAQAAQASTRVQTTRIEVNGYTDSSGTARYNLGLSQRRAQNVAAELVRDGVPGGAISIQGFGETHPLVPTAAGVREPQNRRVEIILR